MVTPATDARRDDHRPTPPPSPVRVLVLNPNSSIAVTTAIRTALDPYETERVRFTVEQIDAAPHAIATPEDHRVVTPLVVRALRREADGYDAVVVACHGDPGVHESRGHTHTPVLGIGEASFHAAAAVTDRFAVLTLSDALVDRKWGQIRAAGLERSCAAVVPTNTTVDHGTGPDPDLTSYEAAGRQAIRTGAHALILGCAGMSPLTARLAHALHVPVIDPVIVTAHLASTLTASHPVATMTRERSTP